SELLVVQGRVMRASGWVVEALLPGVAVGTHCDVITQNNRTVRAEVVGFSGTTALLMPLGDISGISEGSAVLPRPNDSALLGRVVNASLEPMDDGAPLTLNAKTALRAAPPKAMSRRRIARSLTTGVK